MNETPSEKDERDRRIDRILDSIGIEKDDGPPPQSSDEDEELDGFDILRQWQDRKGIHRFEGDSGLENLETLLEELGYHDTGFKFGTPIESFLSDNPGAVQKILEFIEEQMDKPNCDWRESLQIESDDEEETDGK